VDWAIQHRPFCRHWTMKIKMQEYEIPARHLLRRYIRIVVLQLKWNWSAKRVSFLKVC
jgi:hypothetical protein